MAVNNLPDLLYGDGQDNMGGLQTIGYYARVTDFERGGIKQPPSLDAGTTLEELATISVAHEFKAGKAWKQMYGTEDTGMVESAQQGELDGKSFLNKRAGFFPGSQAKLLGWVRLMNNAGVIAIGVDAEGLRRQVGSEQYPGKISTSNHTTTATAAGRKGYTYEITCSSPFPAPIYAANLELPIESELSSD